MPRLRRRLLESASRPASAAYGAANVDRPAPCVVRGALGERECRVDDPDVRERLRKVPERTLGDRIDLLGEEPDVVCARERRVEDVLGGCEGTSPAS